MRIHTPAEIGLLAKEARCARHWTQAQLADAIGATRQWVRLLESGKPRLELGLTLRALTALGLTLDVSLPAVVVDASAPRSAGAETLPAATRGQPVGRRGHAQSSEAHSQRSPRGRSR